MRSNLVLTTTRLSSSTALTRPALLTLLAASTVLFPHAAYAVDNTALPYGEQVVGGSASFDRSTKNVLNITQKTDRTVINWNRFDIGANATTQFYQPNSSSLAVNRVVGPKDDPTQILGTLKANGRVMVLDRNGVLFGRDSVVDVGGIVASTGDVDTDAVMSGSARLVLKNLGTSGEVVNNGTITVSEGGLAAFVAPTVRNNGVISAKLGKVALAAGSESATVDLYGDGLVELAVSDNAKKLLSENTGTLIAEAGTIAMTTAAAKGVVDNVVNMSGVVSATSAHMEGGKIVLSAPTGKVKVSGKVAASGKNGGSVKARAKTIELTDTSSLAADALDVGNGGRVDVLADDLAVFGGRISAQGGKTSGNGGVVEVSSGQDLVFTGSVSTAATQGLSGSLIIDPQTMNIHSGPLNKTTGNTNYLSSSLLASLLSSNGTVTVEATKTVNVGTDNIGTGIGNGNIDLRTFWNGESFEKTLGNLNLKATVVNFVKDLLMGDGSVSVNTPTLNLNSKIYGLYSGGLTVLLRDDRLNSDTTLSKINVQSSNALINQAIAFANGNERINVANGTYNESVVVDKSVGLYGTNALVVPNSPGFTVTADNATVYGFEIVGAEDGIRVVGADNVTLSKNYIHNLANGSGIYVMNSVGTTIYHNTIVAGTHEAVLLSNADNAYVHKNLITNSAVGVQVNNSDSENVTIHNNKMLNVTTGIWANAVRNLVITSNQIDGQFGEHPSGSVGIYVGNSGYATIGGTENGNEVEDFEYDVHLVNTWDSDVSNNDISEFKQYGILVESGYGDTLSDNTLYNYLSKPGTGIYVFDSGYTDITNNSIRNMSGNGISVNDSYQTVIQGNEVSDIRNGHGIYVGYTDSTQILNNDVWNVDLNGIFAYSGNNLLVRGNDVSGSGENGIFVEYVRGDTAEGAPDTKMSALRAEEPAPEYFAQIVGNRVSNSGENGINVYQVPRVLISENDVSFSGGLGKYDTLSTKDYAPEFPYGYGYGDGIRVYNYSNPYDSSSGHGLIDILNNNVHFSGDDGIDVSFRVNAGKFIAPEFGSTEPTIVPSYINILGNDVSRYGDDGITVGVMTSSPSGSTPMDSIYIRDWLPTVSVLIDNNTVDALGESLPVGSPAAGVNTSDYKTLYGYGDGIQVNANIYKWENVALDTTVSNNIVSNNAQNGIYISGPSHGDVVVSGNVLNDNDVGALFESGDINLTGASNQINGGYVGLMFRPYIIGYSYEDDYSDYYTLMAPLSMGTPIYANMSLVKNTIGTTAFSGQGEQYIVLENGAFFDPGRPTILNGVNASYDGFSPSSTGGIITQAQKNDLESMIYHYNDDNSLGLFLFGTLASQSSASLAFEDVFRTFGSYNPQSPSGGLLVTGLPNTGFGGFRTAGLAPTGGAGGGFSPDNLANIAPAAGEEEGTDGQQQDAQNQPQNVGAIEPAAGGGDQATDAACWNDATADLQRGTSVSYSFGDQATDLLDKAAACGSSAQ